MSLLTDNVQGFHESKFTFNSTNAITVKLPLKHFFRNRFTNRQKFALIMRVVKVNT